MSLQDLINDVTTRDLTMFARAVPTPADWTLTTGADCVFPALKLESTLWEITNSGRYVNAAKFRAYDASAPIATREAWETTRKGGLPVISQKLTVSEQEIILDELQRGANADRLVKNLYDDTERHVEATKGRVELAAADVLLDGKLTVNENNFITEVDFGVPAENLPTAPKLWSDPTADAIRDELGWLQYLEDIGSPSPAFALTSRRVVNTWSANNAYRAAYYKSVNPSNTPTASLTPDQVNSVRIEYGLPPIRIYKGQVRVDGAWVKPIPDDRYIYVPPQREKWANVQWGLNADSIVLSSGTNPAIEREEAPGIVVTRDIDGDPIRIWTKVNASAMPVMHDPRAHLVAKVL
ncbi:major capsid protein [Streptomyces sp. NPDC056308]|uniref:major capsid protein n=1 Tax=Streptomyces sp. NPDC056308 TaxID=3345780 RepID=UPI0035DEA470